MSMIKSVGQTTERELLISRDLMVTKKSESWVVMEDKTYNIAYTVANTGSGDAGASTTLITIDGVDAATDAVPALSPSESRSHTRTVYD